MKKNSKSKNNLNKYKEAIIQYECKECNFCDNFQEDLKSQISKIKSDSCSHFSFKFIYNLEGESFKYIISFNCNNCGANHMINIIDENIIEDNTNINYKCKQCGNGSMDIGIILIIDSNFDDDFKKENNFNDDKDKEKKNIKIYTTKGGSINRNDVNMKNFNNNENKHQGINVNYNSKVNDKVIGGRESLVEFQKLLNDNPNNSSNIDINMNKSYMTEIINNINKNTNNALNIMYNNLMNDYANMNINLNNAFNNNNINNNINNNVNNNANINANINDNSNNNNNSNNKQNSNNNSNCQNNIFDYGKTFIYHTFEPFGKVINIKCNNCGHLTKEHKKIGFGKWECKCGRICVTLK